MKIKNNTSKLISNSINRRAIKIKLGSEKLFELISHLKAIDYRN